MGIDIRRLGPGDADLLARLAREADDVDLAGASAPEALLSAPAATACLAGSAVLRWVAQERGHVPVADRACPAGAGRLGPRPRRVGAWTRVGVLSRRERIVTRIAAA